MPASSWSGGTGPDGAMRATTSPSRSRRGRTPAVSGTEDGDVIGPSCPRVGVIENSTELRHVCFTVRRSRRLCSKRTWRTSATRPGETAE